MEEASWSDGFEFESAHYFVVTFEYEILLKIDEKEAGLAFFPASTELLLNHYYNWP